MSTQVVSDTSENHRYVEHKQNKPKLDLASLYGGKGAYVGSGFGLILSVLAGKALGDVINNSLGVKSPFARNSIRAVSTAALAPLLFFAFGYIGLLYGGILGEFSMHEREMSHVRQSKEYKDAARRWYTSIGVE